MTFTILLPTYNRGKILKECLNSIKAQTFHDYEVLILDDCSKDDTFLILKEFGKDPRFKYHTFRNNHGVIKNYRWAFENNLVNGKWILDISDDDFYPNKDTFLLMSQEIDKSDFIVGDFAYNYGDILVFENTRQKIIDNYKASKAASKMCIAMKKEYAKKCILEANISNPYFEWPYKKLYKKGKVTYISTANYAFSMHAHNRRKYLDIYNFIFSMGETAIKNISEENLKDKEKYFRQNFNQFLSNDGSFLHSFNVFPINFIVDFLANFCTCAQDIYLEKLKAIALFMKEHFQAEFDKKYLALNAKLYTYEERNEIIDSSKSFMVYCNTPWGKQIKKQLKQKGLKFLGYIDDGSANKLKNTITCDEFFSSNLKPDFVFIATGRPKLMSDLIDKLSTGYSGKILTLHERDDGA